MKNVICCTYKIRFENFNQVISDGKKRYFEENIATMTFLTPAIYVTIVKLTQSSPVVLHILKFHYRIAIDISCIVTACDLRQGFRYSMIDSGVHIGNTHK